MAKNTIHPYPPSGMLGPSSGCVETMPSMVSSSSLLGLTEWPDSITNFYSLSDFTSTRTTNTRHHIFYRNFQKVFVKRKRIYCVNICVRSGESFSVLTYYCLHRLSSNNNLLSYLQRWVHDVFWNVIEVCFECLCWKFYRYAGNPVINTENEQNSFISHEFMVY